MKTLKPYKVTEAGPLYRVKKYSQITQKLVDSLGWPTDMKRPGIDFKTVPLKRGIRNAFRLSPRYALILACYSAGKGIRAAVSPCAEAGITSRPGKSFAELKRLSDSGLKLYVKEWRGKLSDAFFENYKDYEKDYLKKAASLITFRKGRPCGLFVHVPMKGVSGKTYDFIAWHNLFPGLTAAEKRSARYQAALWFKGTAKRQFAVCLDLFDKESYDFFAGLGFVSCRLLFERRSAAL